MAGTQQRADFEVINASVTKVNGAKDQLESIMSKLRTGIAAEAAGWQGEAGDTFQQPVMENLNRLHTNLRNALEAINTGLQSSGRNTHEAELATRTAFQQRADLIV
jgi:WXG100 family type VII secretion target